MRRQRMVRDLHQIMGLAADHLGGGGLAEGSAQIVQRMRGGNQDELVEDMAIGVLIDLLSNLNDKTVLGEQMWITARGSGMAAGTFATEVAGLLMGIDRIVEQKGLEVMGRRGRHDHPRVFTIGYYHPNNRLLALRHRRVPFG